MQKLDRKPLMNGTKLPGQNRQVMPLCRSLSFWQEKNEKIMDEKLYVKVYLKRKNLF